MHRLGDDFIITSSRGRVIGKRLDEGKLLLEGKNLLII